MLTKPYADDYPDRQAVTSSQPLVEPLATNSDSSDNSDNSTHHLAQNQAVPLAVRLSDEERQRLQQYESTIQHNLLEIGLALQDIKESRLYRETHPSLEAYVRDRFNMSKTHAYGQIAAANVIKNLEGKVALLPQNERQCRPLSTLSPYQQQQAWQEVIDTATTENRITNKLVAAIAAKYKPNYKSPEPHKSALPDASGSSEFDAEIDSEFDSEYPATMADAPITIDIDANHAHDLDQSDFNQSQVDQDSVNHLTRQQVNQRNIQQANDARLMHARARLQKLPPQQRRQLQIEQQQHLRKLVETLFLRCTPAMSKLVQHKLDLYLYQFAPEQEISS
jgi:hypothetical protein